MSDPYTTHVCTTCGHEGIPKRRGKGNVGVELLLWLAWIPALFLMDTVAGEILLLIVGLLILCALTYSIRRARSFYSYCPKCNGTKLTPAVFPPVHRDLTPAEIQNYWLPYDSRSSFRRWKMIGVAIGIVIGLAKIFWPSFFKGIFSD